MAGMPMTVDGTIKPDTGHDKYIDWMEDDTQRDPTPANQRRAEMVKATKPKDGEKLKGFHGKMLGLKVTGNKE